MAGKEKSADGMSIINSHIENQSFSRVYLLGGDEGYLVRQYKDKLIDALCDRTDSMNYMAYKGEKAVAEDIREFAMTMPFFADRRVILVEDSDFFNKGNEAVEAFMEEIPETTVVIFVETNIDKRLKLYKLMQKEGTIALFRTPDEATLLKWVKSLFTREKMSIDDEAVYGLVRGVGTDMNTLYNESMKLICYCMDKDRVTMDCVEKLCTNQVESKIFDMMDALSQRNVEKTMRLYDDLLMLREPAMRLLFLITRQFNILLKIKFALETGVQNSGIAGFAKIPPFTVKKYMEQCKGYTYKQLIACVELCQQTDGSIKSGRMKDSLAVEMLIMELLKHEGETVMNT
ncbi:MAG: DNA polymerase III subunit delta [Clostridium sp.]|nr:DNA polymerase III subunit delta [Clostridium sp.]MCM1172944.1 DNA polymerase III subunit delta [Clostridium sp.]MCM1208931.1 DNA polymerase III subunit delta [Ruminococcus sp.]